VPLKTRNGEVIFKEYVGWYCVKQSWEIFVGKKGLVIFNSHNFDVVLKGLIKNEDL